MNILVNSDVFDSSKCKDNILKSLHLGRRFRKSAGSSRHQRVL